VEPLKEQKGQFMIISAVIASLIVITLSGTISEIQNQDYEQGKLSEHINQVRDEAERITSDGVITRKEKRNFRKMTGYIDGYRVTSRFNTTKNCVQVTMENPSETVELPCMN
jgi:hypothetical protein